MIPSYVPLAFYSIVALCAAASLYVMWETFSKVWDFTQRQLHIKQARREQAEYEKRMKLMGNSPNIRGADGVMRANPNWSSAAGQTISGGLGQQQCAEKISTQGNVFPLGVCRRENPHTTCNGTPRPDCDNGR